MRITDLIQSYRLALHHIWNYHFWMHDNLRTGDAYRQFESLKLPLFSVLVADRLLDLDYRDFVYYRVRIVSYADHPELEGREALVEVGEADVEWILVDTSEPAPAAE